MKPLTRFVAGYLTIVGAASLVGLAAVARPSSLDAWGFVNGAILILMCVVSMVAGVRLWRNPASAGAHELSLTALGAQVPHLVLPGFGWSITAGLSVFVGMLRESLTITWDASAFSFVRLGHHDAPFELGVNLVPLLLLVALRRWGTAPSRITVETIPA